MNISIKPISADNRPDFARVHCDENESGWCNCVAWWVPTWDGFSERSALQNLELRNDLFERGEFDGFLLYLEGEPVGWCQCGPRDRLTKLISQYKLERGPQTWAITCFVLAPGCRGKHLGNIFLQAVVTELASQGIRHIQGFPRNGDNLLPGDVWTGTVSMFRSANFVVERDHDRFPIYGLRLRSKDNILVETYT